MALFLYYVSFAAFLLITVLFLQDVWHYGALQTGLAIAPGPATAAVFAINAGRITGRFGRTAPAVAGPTGHGRGGALLAVAGQPAPRLRRPPSCRA